MFFCLLLLNILRVRIDLELQSERSRGFGFVTMRDTGDATEAIRQLNGVVSISVIV
jgi:RNA recognition motif-containing protein